MATIELLSVHSESRDGMQRLVGTVQLADGAQRAVFFAVAAEHASMLHAAADAFVPALLVPAMAQGVDLEFGPPISEQLLSQLEVVQDVLVRFHGFRRARISAQPRSGGAPVPTTATNFSLGVDSGFTLMRSLQGAVRGTRPAECLLFFKGLEHPLSTMADVSEALAIVARVAEQTGTRVVVLETNLRDVFNPDYPQYYFGAALASASLALASGIGTVLVPASQDYASLEPHGSHPLLDPLWSTERQRRVVTGLESRRVDKLAALAAEWPESLDWLRVCISHAGGSTNCGRCNKCARTMAALEVLGVLERSASFPHALSAEAWRQLARDYEHFLVELLDFGHERAPGRPITAALDRALQRARRKIAVRAVAENTPLLRPLFLHGRRLKRGVRHVLRGGPAYDSPSLFRRVRGLVESARSTRHGR